MARGKSDDGPPWFDRLGIDRAGRRIVGMFNGIVTLTADPDGLHIVWLYDHPVASGDARSMRNRYADHMPGDWLERLYRS